MPPKREHFTADYEGTRFRQGATELSQQAVAKLIKQFRAVRLAAGLTLTEVARRGGLDDGALSYFENGKKDNPTLATLFRWAGALGLELTIKASKPKMPKK